MYEEQKAYQGSMVAGLGIGQRRLDITIGENLNERIVMAEKHLQELKDTKSRIESTGLLTARIDDLRRAMDY